jgi:RNA polymerase sigma-70 factor, ECF subfamily
VARLQSVLERLEEAARALPDVRADMDAFATYLAAKSEGSVEDVHVTDLYLAWACAEGDPAALAMFDREYLTRVRALARGTDPAELEQLVRVRLLIAEAGATARIRQYSGKGPLVAWVRMVATRIAIDLARAARPQAQVGEHAPDGTFADPELDYLKARYAEAFHSALERALTSLSVKERALLRLSYVDGATPGAIARMYAVSVRTAQRWLVDARARVLLRTREELTGALSLRPAELDSLLDLMKSQLHVTLRRVLVTSADSVERP